MPIAHGVGFRHCRTAADHQYSSRLWQRAWVVQGNLPCTACLMYLVPVYDAQLVCIHNLQHARSHTLNLSRMHLHRCLPLALSASSLDRPPSRRKYGHISSLLLQPTAKAYLSSPLKCKSPALSAMVPPTWTSHQHQQHQVVAATAVPP